MQVQESQNFTNECQLSLTLFYCYKEHIPGAAKKKHPPPQKSHYFQNNLIFFAEIFRRYS